MSIKPVLPADRKSNVDDLISVLLPVYNAEFNIGGALKSILDQSYPKFEIIVVDDGSTDSSGAIISHLAKKDSRIKSFTFPVNRGIVSALNHGLNHCSGKWIARMDADDLMMPHRLQRQMTCAKESPEVDIWGCRIELFGFHGNLSMGQIRYQDWSNSLLTDQDIKSNIYAESPIMHPTFFLTSEVYQKLGGYSDNPWAEDYDFLLKADLNQAVFGKLPEVLLKKGDHPSRLAKTDIRCKRKAMFRAKAHYFALKPHIWKGKKIIILGSGSAGRLAFKSLEEKGISVHCFADNTSGDRNRTVMGLPAKTLTPDSAEQFLAEYRDSLFLLCIGNDEGREFVERLLQKNGFIEGRAYFRFI